MSAPRLEAYVEEAVVSWLGSGEAAAAFRRVNEPSVVKRARLQLAGMEQQLRDARAAAQRFGFDGQPEMSALTLAGLESGLRPQMDKLQRQIEDASVPAVLRGIVGNSDADRVWESLDLHARRMVLREIVTIRLYQARTQGVKDLTGRVTLAFYGESGFRTPSA